MGISTVSGPFRSANGFQQLDENGVWVPVGGGGGGGGGGNPSVLTVVLPIDGSTNVLNVPVPTQAGQTYIITPLVTPNGVLGNGTIDVNFVPSSPSYAIAILGVELSTSYGNVQQFGDIGGAGEIITFPFPDNLWAMQVTYVGNLDFFGELYNTYTAQYWQYGG